MVSIIIPVKVSGVQLDTVSRGAGDFCFFFFRAGCSDWMYQGGQYFFGQTPGESDANMK